MEILTVSLSPKGWIWWVASFVCVHKISNEFQVFHQKLQSWEKLAFQLISSVSWPVLHDHRNPVVIVKVRSTWPSQTWNLIHDRGGPVGLTFKHGGPSTIAEVIFPCTPQLWSTTLCNYGVLFTVTTENKLSESLIYLYLFATIFRLFILRTITLPF